MELWTWAILLLFVGLALAMMEVFIPSSGILGLLSFCAILAAVVLGFMHGPGAGFAILATAMFGLPAVVILALKWWPLTPMGRRFLLENRTSEEVLPDNPKLRGLKELVGRVGVAKSKMLPCGAVTIDGRTIDAISEGVFIEPGRQIRVIDVRGTQVVVRPLDVETLLEPGDDPLSRPIDSVGPDPFEGPPA